VDEEATGVNLEIKKEDWKKSLILERQR